MPVLSTREIYEVALEAGFSDHAAVTWTAIAKAESGGRTGALNDRGEHSMGLWQINVAGDVRDNKWGNLNDPAVNARAAFEISRGGRDMRPWTTTHDHNKGTAADYRTYLSDVEAEIGVAGDPRGVEGYRSPLPPPLEHNSYDRIDSGRSLGEQSAQSLSEAPPIDGGEDSDSDGLTDAFEKLAETGVKDKDSDDDGLSDSYEAVVSHTDPLREDTDSDGLADAAELAAGSDAGRLPGMAAVVGTGVFAENVRDGVKDADSDGLSDHVEKLVGTNDAEADTDNDQLGDAAEAALGTDPTRADSDDDGLTDGFETEHGGDPLSPLLDPSGRSIPVPRWTLDDAYQRRSAESSSTEEAPRTSPAATQDTTSHSHETESGSQGDLDRVTFGGETVDRRTSLMLAEAERLANERDPSIGEFDLTQGSWSHASASSGTHGGPGAFDLYSEGYSSEQKEIIGLAFRQVGFASWLRKESQGPWNEHWHGIAMGTEGLPSIAAGQVTDYLAGGDGLKGNGRDKDPRPEEIGTWEEYQEAGRGSRAEEGSTTGDQFDIDSGNDLDGSEDSDADGLTDAFEKLAETDAKDEDSDDDGLSDGYEAVVSHTDPLAEDTDEDGLTDASEVATGTDPGKLPGVAAVVGSGAFAENIRDGIKDADSDGLSDHAEKILNTNADKADTDGDRLSDAAEIALHTNPLLGDTDGDGLFDGIEAQYNTDPLTPGPGLYHPTDPSDDPDQPTDNDLTAASLLDG